MTQSIEYVVKVNASQAAAAIAEVEKRFGGVDNAAMRLDKQIIALERDIKDLNAAIAAGGPNVEHYKKQLLELQAAATGAAGNPNAGRGVGGGVLQLSQTLDDLQYGVRGVVNNIPGLLQGFGLGAGIAGAAQIAMIAVSQLTDKLTAYIKKQQEASQAAIKGRLSLLDVRIAAMQETADLQAELDRINTEIEGGTGKVAEEESRKRLAGLRENISNAEQEIANRQAVLRNLERMQFRSSAQDDQIKATKAYIQDRKNRIAADNAAIEQEIKNQEIREKIAAAAKKLEDKREAESKAKKSKFVDGVITAAYDPSAEALSGMFSTAGLRKTVAENIAEREMEAEIDAAAARKSIQMESLRADALIRKIKWEQDEEARKESERAAKEHMRRRIAEEKRTQAEIARGEKALVEYRVDLAQTVTQGLTSSLVDYLDAKARGEKDAEARAVAGFLSTTGKQLIGAGVKGVFEGAILSANPYTPGAGAGMIATGGAAIVAGMAMAGGGAAITGSLSAATGAAGGRSPSGARRDPGASPGRTTGGTGGGGPLVVNVAYGVAGPAPEDTARAVARATRTGDRRSGR